MGAASRALELTEAIHTSCPTRISTTWTREEKNLETRGQSASVDFARCRGS